MVYSFQVYKKESPNGKLRVYLGKRDFVDHLTAVDPVDGVVVFENDYLKDRKIYGQLIVTFRYGREEDEVMGLQFSKDLYLASEEIYPKPEKSRSLSSLQERLVKKLGSNSIPFTFNLPIQAPTSVTLQSGPDDEGKPCGVEYTLKIYVAENEEDRGHRRSTIAMVIRKIQYAPARKGKQPYTVARKDFLLSPGQMELEMTLDKQLYHHGEEISVNFTIRNNSNKTVKKIKASIIQTVDICLFTSGQYKSTVASLETQEGCPLAPGGGLQRVVTLLPAIKYNRDKRGIALDGRLKNVDTNLASTTLLLDANEKDNFGIIVSYTARVKLYLGVAGGELSAELPFILMHPKPKLTPVRADSQWDVEDMKSSRQNTMDEETLDENFEALIPHTEE